MAGMPSESVPAPFLKSLEGTVSEGRPREILAQDQVESEGSTPTDLQSHLAMSAQESPRQGRWVCLGLAPLHGKFMHDA